MLVRELAEWLGAAFDGDGETEISAVAPLDTAGANDVAFAAGKKALQQARSSSAGCLLVPPDFDGAGRTVIRVSDPRAAAAKVIHRLHPPAAFEPGIHPSAVIAKDAALGEGVSIAGGVSIGNGASIGAGTRIGPGCAVGDGVKIGAHCILHANVTLYTGVELGSRVVLHAGCVLGADGFGFVLDKDHYEKFPQIGQVHIGNDVEIGANSCVDRAALGVTSIGDGAKLDNMVHIGHNCQIGRHVVIAAQTGLSGGVEVGDYAIIGGQVGIGDKVRIEPRAVLGSGAGVLTSKVVRAGQVMWGTPARPLKEHLELLANLGRIPELRQQVREIQEHLNLLTKD